MKKILFLMAAAVATMASCSEDKIAQKGEQESDGVIGFTTYATSTKGVSIEDTEDLQDSDIGVVAFHSTLDDPYMGYTDKGSQIVYSGTWDHFDITESRYWPTDGATLDFIAYTPYTDDSRVVEPTFSKTTGMSFEGYVVDSDVTKHQDLMYDMNLDETKPDVGTNTDFVFKHALTQVHFIAKTKADNLFAQIAENGITIHNVGSVGSLDIAIEEPQNALWTSVKTPTDYTMIFDETCTIDSETSVEITTKDQSAMLIPQELTAWDVEDGSATEQSGAYLTISFKMYQATSADADTKTYVIGSEDEYMTVYVPISTQDADGNELWEVAKAVSYTLTFGGGYYVDGTPILTPITFTATVSEWGTTSNDLSL